MLFSRSPIFLYRLFVVVLLAGFIGLSVLILRTQEFPLYLYIRVLLPEPQKNSRSPPTSPCQMSDDDDAILVNTTGPVINAHPYRFTINNPNLCRWLNDSNEGPLVLIYVHTAPTHPHRRDRIRQTWANQSYFGGIRLRTIFVVGRSGGARRQAELEMEAQRFGDMVQENFTEGYRQLTHKTVAGLRWITEYCPQATYIIKADDDVFVNMFTIVKHIKDL